MEEEISILKCHLDWWRNAHQDLSEENKRLRARNRQLANALAWIVREERPDDSNFDTFWYAEMCGIKAREALDGDE